MPFDETGYASNSTKIWGVAIAPMVPSALQTHSVVIISYFAR